MPKSMRLSFKGEEKKKKHKSSSSSHRSSRSEGKRRADADGSDVEEYGGDEQAWVSVESPPDLNGPCFLFQDVEDPSSSKSTPYTLQYNPTLQSILPTSVAPPDISGQQSAGLLLDSADGASAEDLAAATIAGIEVTPTHVHQVWIANRVAGSTTWSFRNGPEGRFMGADKHGVVSAASEARGPQEGWEVVPARGGRAIALRSAVHGGFLTLDLVAGGKVVVRADGDSADECAWHARVQWKYRHAARAEIRERQRASGAAASVVVKQGQAGMVIMEDRSAGAKHRSAERLLEQRTKSKSDRYAK